MSRPSNRRLRRDALRRYIAALPAKLEEVNLSESQTMPSHVTRSWRSRHFTAQLFDEPNGLRLSIQRSEEAEPVRMPGRERPISWDELMEVKRQAGFSESWAVEIFPPDDQVVDVAPMRHLWILEEPPAYGWRDEEGDPRP